jgi:serine phosphatase RsbU (regulator of sigma subunit)/type II secretory pathway pseudopilin PulG
VIGRQKFQSRRVFIVHGVLLVAVLVVAYLSAAAQYEAMRDGRIEEVRSEQQVALRGAGQVIQQSMRKLATDLAVPDRLLLPGVGTRSEDWLTAVVVVDTATGRVITTEKPPPATVTLPAKFDLDAAALRSSAPVLRVTAANNSPLILLLAPAEPGRARVGVIAGDQLLGEITSKATAEDQRVAVLMTPDGMVFAGASAAGKSILDAITDRRARHELTRMLSTNNAASAVVQNDQGNAAVLAVQAIDPLPDVRWYAVAWRPDEGARIRAALQPLLWQLVGGASLIIVAVGIVLASTTMSLYRGRRRIEELRMEMLHRDLEKARRIQLNWLPAPRRHTETLEIAAENKAAAHISGDFYNWFDLGPDSNCPTPRTALVIGDVSGHGLAAAFLMATTQMIVRNTLPRLCDPGACLTDLNKQLASLVYNGQFVTIAVLVLDLEAGEMEIASAGHAPPLLRRGDNVVEIEADPDLVAGVDADTTYHTHHVRIEPGDTLLLYTDGAIEAHNEAGEQFGVDGLRAALASAPPDVDAVLAHVIAAVEAHHNDEDAEDDLTLVAVRLLPAAVTAGLSEPIGSLSGPSPSGHSLT